jgi:hypothetical protein
VSCLALLLPAVDTDFTAALVDVHLNGQPIPWSAPSEWARS